LEDKNLYRPVIVLFRYGTAGRHYSVRRMLAFGTAIYGAYAAG